MNTITLIENALKAINQAAFQSLINHLLYLQGNRFIGAPGTVVGKEKTSKGTPDSFFVNEDRYTFVECTTQERLGESRSFFEKLSKDIDHCFKNEITAINKEKIEKVILACNEKISASEYNSLNTQVKSHNPRAKFEVLNIQNLPLLIFEIPKLAEEYLNVAIIKGDIYTLEQFLLKTKKGLQPSLTNDFIGREEELKKSIEALKRQDVLLLSGGAGVGKSKLGVRILEELSKENYIPVVIQSSGVSLWDDYKHLFLPGKQYIILFDDANKSITNLNYLLSKINSSQSYTAKVVITSRDYVKKQLSTALENISYIEESISEFRDEEIEMIIVAALPNLKYHNEIKRKIIELAKGNARVALMATYSVTPDSEINYLSSPVLLYEKYFKKISEEIGIFNNPIILKSLAIVSFFGVLDRNNDELKLTLSTNFGIDWNELWTAIMELHNSEILDVHSQEIVKVSDQVLATYAFYKCFIDNKFAVINYAQWIVSFIDKYPNRIRATLIDINNTFVYDHVRGLALPHLNVVINQINSEEKLYAFYDLFWFYKGRECLLFLRNWVNNLEQQEMPEQLKFSYVHNDHTSASKYFDLLKSFWSHPNELLNPSLHITLTLLEKQPNRLPEVLKFIHEDFKYKLGDIEYGYFRQNILLDILLDENLDGTKRSLADGIFLNLAEALLGWRYSEFGSGKGRSFTIQNFELYKSVELTKLRTRILTRICQLFESQDERFQKILYQIVYPGGNIDKSIYIDELPLYQKFISEKLDNKQYAHCKFVSVLAKHVIDAGESFPESWNGFIESDVRKLSRFLKPDWEYREGKSIDESESEKRKEFDDFVRKNDWASIETLLLNIDDLYKQQKDNNGWNIESAVADIYVSIARKNEKEFENALRLFFSGKVSFPLRTTVINVALIENIKTGEELLQIMNDYEFKGKPYWKSVLLGMLPTEQINESFLVLLIEIFQQPDDNIYIHRMIDFQKYETVFEVYKNRKPKLVTHNVITYLTSIMLAKDSKARNNLGFHFCSYCASYFTAHANLLKDAYWVQHKMNPHFDYDGRELKAVLSVDRKFINNELKNNKIGLGFSSPIRLKKINTNVLWERDDYEELIEDLLSTLLEKKYWTFINEEDIYSLFTFKNNDENKTAKAKSLISKLTQKHGKNEKIAPLLVEIVYHNFREWFLEYYREFLLINNDIEVTKLVNFDGISSTSGSWVPVYQKKIEFYQDVLKMINSLPNILDYSEHINYFEERIAWKERDIEREQRRDFMDEFY